MPENDQAGAASGLRAVLATPAAVRLWLAGGGARGMRWVGILGYPPWGFAETGPPLLVPPP
ncbi:MAG TPA: hypothetical protein PKA13_26475, partial [Geminicoccaceae bacterium]|nr:hypothetical protein [Geminicoccaceae bacterium]